jgi:hypothetical protein
MAQTLVINLAALNLPHRELVERRTTHMAVLPRFTLHDALRQFFSHT